VHVRFSRLIHIIYVCHDFRDSFFWCAPTLCNHAFMCVQRLSSSRRQCAQQSAHCFYSVLQSVCIFSDHVFVFVVVCCSEPTSDIFRTYAYEYIRTHRRNGPYIYIHVYVHSHIRTWICMKSISKRRKSLSKLLDNVWFWQG